MELSASKLYEVEPGDFVYNRLFAWKGSFALATAAGHVSGEFPVFRVAGEQVDPRYLLALTRTLEFMAEVDRRSAGSTPTSRNRLKEAELLEIEVPLPSLSHQAAVVEQLALVGQIRSRSETASEARGALVPAMVNEVFGQQLG